MRGNLPRLVINVASNTVKVGSPFSQENHDPRKITGREHSADARTKVAAMKRNVTFFFCLLAWPQIMKRLGVANY
jgi:hypothetical protein